MRRYYFIRAGFEPHDWKYV